MEITKTTMTSSKKQKQQQKQQQSKKQEQPQEQQQQQQQPLQPQVPQQQALSIKPVQVEMVKPMKMKGEFVTISKAKLVMVMATCLLATLFACCTKFRGDYYNEEHELDEQSKSVQQEQMLVRKYVNERLKMYSGNTRYSQSHDARRQGYMFAKLILNAYDRPYQQVLDAINQRLKEIKDAGDNKEALKSIKPAARMLTEAYGKALESSQRHSVLIQDEIRRSQEQMRNQVGEMSLLDESLAQWHLEELADFERRLVDTYLMYALEQQVN